MIESVFKLIKKYRMRRIKQYMILEKDSVYGTNFFVEVRKPQKEVYLTIGHHCLIDGRFIFEKESGSISIGNNVHIGNNTKLISVNEIIVEDEVIISWGCMIYDHNSHSVYTDERKNDVEQEYRDYCKYGNSLVNKDWSVVKSKPIHIKKGAWIGFDVVILKGVTIGEGAVVGARSVVTKDVPPYSVVGGNPAKVLYLIDEKRNDRE